MYRAASQDPVADLLRRLDARVDRVGDADEDPPVARRVLAQDLEDALADPVSLASWT